MKVRIRGSKPGNGQTHRGLGTVLQSVRVLGANDRSRQRLTVADVTAHREMAIGEDGALERETGAHIRSGAVATSGRTGEERKAAAQIVVLFFCRVIEGGIIERAENGAIG